MTLISPAPSVVISKLQVQDFDGWKAQYDRGEPMRRELGVRGVTVLREAEDSNVVHIHTRFDSLEAAKAMLASPQWREATKNVPANAMQMTIAETVEAKTY